MLSSTATYALRAVLYVARHEDAGPVRVGDVAAALDLPQNYLAKVLHALARGGLLHSTRGKRGGFRLAKAPAQTALHSVVRQFDQITTRRTCLLGRHDCSDRHPCAAHGRWRAIAEATALFFRETTLEHLLDGQGAEGPS
jgi:Rrf2 family transcriptional regulator, iron-sulfur cluster assembly transcription factor